MSDPGQRAARLRDRIAGSWTPERAERVSHGMARRRARRAALRWTAGAAAVLLALTASLLLRPRLTPLPEGVIPLADGSQIQPLSPGARIDVQRDVQVRRDAPGEVTVALLAGGARFVVTPARARVFRVLAGPVTVEVLGTIFTVTRAGADVHVAVERGRVRARWATGERELGQAEQGHFPPASPKVGALPPPAPAPPPPAAPPPAAARPAPQPPSPSAPGGAAALMAAADEARARRRPRETLALLRQLVQRHPNDRRAPLAAFTLGRVLLDDLDRPAEAAESFALVRRLDPRGVLVEDSLAREVEAWSRAGAPSKVWERAEEYLRRFPQGTWVREVRRRAQVD